MSSFPAIFFCSLLNSRISTGGSSAANCLARSSATARLGAKIRIGPRFACNAQATSFGQCPRIFLPRNGRRRRVSAKTSSRGTGLFPSETSSTSLPILLSQSATSSGLATLPLIKRSRVCRGVRAMVTSYPGPLR